jgi:hypothetical protein
MGSGKFSLLKYGRETGRRERSDHHVYAAVAVTSLSQRPQAALLQSARWAGQADYYVIGCVDFYETSGADRVRKKSLDVFYVSNYRL